MIYLSPFFEELTGFSIEHERPLPHGARLAGAHSSRGPRARLARGGCLRLRETTTLPRNTASGEPMARTSRSAISTAAMLDDAGEIIAWQGIMVDITAGIDAREAISRLASIVEASDDAIFSRDPRRRRYHVLEFRGRALVRIFGGGGSWSAAEHAVCQSGRRPLDHRPCNLRGEAIASLRDSPRPERRSTRRRRGDALPGAGRRGGTSPGFRGSPATFPIASSPSTSCGGRWKPPRQAYGPRGSSWP